MSIAKDYICVYTHTHTHSIVDECQLYEALREEGS